MKEEDICGGSLNTIWAGGALRDTEVEVRFRGAGGWLTTTRSPPRRGAAQHIPHHQVGGPLPILLSANEFKLGGMDRRGGARGGRRR